VDPDTKQAVRNARNKDMRACMAAHEKQQVKLTIIASLDLMSLVKHAVLLTPLFCKLLEAS
jgi:kynureninase